MKNHYFDGLMICLKCDMCEDPNCCPDTIRDCDGKNWEFMNRMQVYMNRIKRERTR